MRVVLEGEEHVAAGDHGVVTEHVGEDLREGRLSVGAVAEQDDQEMLGLCAE